jgi:hypothetical protein
VLATGTKCPIQVFYVWLVKLQNICAKERMVMWPSPINDISTCLIDMQRSWTKTLFETRKARYDVNGVSLFHHSYLKTIMTYMCSHRIPNIQIKYFMFDWSIYRLFVLNTDWKHYSPQMMVFVNICSTWSIV